MNLNFQHFAIFFILLCGPLQLCGGFGIDFASLLDDDAEDLLTCVECRAAVGVLQDLLVAGATEAEVANASIALCMEYNLFTDDVCVEMVQLAAPQFVFVINTTEHDIDSICHGLTGACKSTLPPWSIDIPGGKPEVAPPVYGNTTIRILHLSDTHFDPGYIVGSPATCDHPSCCRDWNDTINENTTFAGLWGAESGSCDPPFWTLEAALNAVELMPDLIYVTGDLSPHVVWMLDEDDIRASVVDTAEVIRRYFPTTPVAYTLGNHESVPVNSFPVPAVYPDGYDMDWLYPLLASVWGDGGVPDSAMDTILKGGYYHWSPVPGLRVVSINANYGHRGNWFLLIDDVDPTEQLSWLTQVLLDAETAGEKVHVIGHITWGSLLESFSHSLNQLLTRFESIITGIFVGHSHEDEIQLFWDVGDNTRPVGVAYFAPSLSSNGDKSPSFRVYEVDGPDGSWTVRESLTYSMNLTLANAGAAPDFPLAYSATAAYGLPDLTPAAWASAVFQMANDTELFDEYFRHYHSFWEEPADLEECDAECRGDMLCKMVSGDSSDSEPCERIQALVPGYGNSTRPFKN